MFFRLCFHPLLMYSIVIAFPRNDLIHQPCTTVIREAAFLTITKTISGRRRILHFIPDWAIAVFSVCGVSVLAGILIEWYIVRRKAGSLRASAAGATDPARAAKTHLMF